MIRRQHLVRDFYSGAAAMRDALDARFRKTYAHHADWAYFCDPQMYTYLRTEPRRVFPRDLLETFEQRLRLWCIEHLGLVPMGSPFLHLMVNGCKLGLHSDFHNGCWGYVYSLTRWETRTFSGGETLLLRDGVPSYKKHHAHGELLYELIPAHFNQLLIFDDRIVHATPAIEGSMDPTQGRIALVGHIRATSPLITGELDPSVVRNIILQGLNQLRDPLRSYRDIQGTVTYKLTVDKTGSVASATPLTDNLVNPYTGYNPSDIVATVKSLIQRAITGLKFPAANSTTAIIVPILVPIPDLRPIESTVRREPSSSTTDDRLADPATALAELDLRGDWEGRTYFVREPTVGSIRFEPDRITACFDPPMWVPSQREDFQNRLSDLLKRMSVATTFNPSIPRPLHSATDL